MIARRAQECVAGQAGWHTHPEGLLEAGRGVDAVVATAVVAVTAVETVPA